MVKLYKNPEVTQNAYNNCNLTNNAGLIMNTAQNAAALLSQIFSSYADGSYSGTYTEIPSSTPTAEVKPQEKENEEIETEETKQELRKKHEQEVLDLLKDARPDFKETSEYFKELTDKYEVYMTNDFYKDLREDKVSMRTRLCNYLDALISHGRQFEYGSAYKAAKADYMAEHNKTENSLTEEDYTAITKLSEKAVSKIGLVDKNNSIKFALDKRDKVENTEYASDKEKAHEAKLALAGYLNKLKGNAEGYIDLYDINSDGKISKDEFTKFEADDAKKLDIDYDATVTEQLFDMIDTNNSNFIETKEMAAYNVGRSRIFDSLKVNTSYDITFGEWAYSQTSEGMQKVGERLNDFYNYNNDVMQAIFGDITE